MKANDKDTKAFRLIGGHFCSSKWWFIELWFWLSLLAGTVLSKWLGWF